jgi:hypothetical protein
MLKIDPKPFLLEAIGEGIVGDGSKCRLVLFEIAPDGFKSVRDIVEGPDAFTCLRLVLGSFDYDDLCVEHPDTRMLLMISPARKTVRAQCQQLYDLWLRVHPDKKVVYRA